MTARLALIVCFIAGGIAAAAETDLQGEVQRLVRQLDAPQLAQRDAAEAAIVDRGPAVVPFLPAANEQVSAEVKQRVDRIRQRLERVAADSVAEASTITLHADDMALSKILHEFQEQSGNTIVDYRREFGQPVSERKLAVNCDKAPFWPALDRVLDQAGLAVYPFAKPRAIGVVAASVTKHNGIAHAAYSGPFRLEAVSVEASRYFRGVDASSLIVNLEVAWEPRLRVISLTQRMADVTAIDDRGDVVPVAESEAEAEVSLSGETSAVRLDVPLRLPPREVRKIERIKGKLLATIAGKTETFRFANLAKAHGIQQRIAGATVTLEQVHKSDDGYEVRMRARFDDAGDALASHRQWIFKNAARLKGANGKTVSYDSFDTIAQEKNEIGLAYRFKTERPLGELTFVYTTPSTIVTRSYGYDLKDIELP